MQPDGYGDVTLAKWLSTRAHALSARAMVCFVGAGVLLVTAAWVWPSVRSWPITGVGLCSAAFGAWAIAEGQLIQMLPLANASRNGLEHKAWCVLRGVAAVTGVLSGVTLLIALPFVFLGTWIS